jgi:hypothetical protein
MAATVVISESNGASPTVTDGISNINFGSTDATGLTPASYPITIQSAGTAYSYEKWLRVKISGTYNKVDNLQWWMATTPSTGVSVYSSDTADLNLSYTTPVATVSTPAHNACPTSDPGTANIPIGGALAGSSLSNATTYSNYIVLQLRVGTTAVAGDMTQLTFSFQYDEQ